MSGTGPDAVTGNTYSQIQQEQARRDLAIKRRSRFGPEQPDVLPTGTAPRNPNYVWNADRGAEPPLDESEGEG